MKKLPHSNRFHRLYCATAIVLAASSMHRAQAQQDVNVVEYYVPETALYFITGRPSEQAALDALPAQFIRTGKQFAAINSTAASSTTQAICRYMIDIPGSQWKTHFYGLPSDCSYLETTITDYRLDNFTYEGLDFAVAAPNSSGICPATHSVPVYRFLRKLTPVDVSNHRYAVTAAELQEMLQRGWTDEGTAFCITHASAAKARPTFAPSSNYAGKCEIPRTGSSPYSGIAYPDQQGTLDDEKNWLRAWSDETYLWYREIPELNAATFTTTKDFFAALKTPAAVVSGDAKDRFHYTDETANVEAQRSQAGDDTLGADASGPPSYGIKWAAVRSSPPREWRIAVVEPNSPAAMAGLTRGDRILQIDGIDFVTGARTPADLDKLNAGLYPGKIGDSHSFVFQGTGGSRKEVDLASVGLVMNAVPKSGYVDTASGRVGYLALTTFSTYASEKSLVDAVAGLQQSNLSDLVLDLRYNGGGLLAISSQLAYMIAGDGRTGGKLYERSKFNDKLPNGLYGETEFPFYSHTLGFSSTAGQSLPTLNLPRVYVLTSGASCSASEALINGLRGIDVEVILIGSQTCGKPYGFYGMDNCGTTYYSIQMTGVNNKGEGDFVDGFAATCSASDDLTRELGNPGERQFAAALAYRTNGRCNAAISDGSDAAAKRGDNDNALSPKLGTIRETNKLLERPSLIDSRKSLSRITPRWPENLNVKAP